MTTTYRVDTVHPTGYSHVLDEFVHLLSNGKHNVRPSGYCREPGDYGATMRCNLLTHLSFVALLLAGLLNAQSTTTIQGEAQSSGNRVATRETSDTDARPIFVELFTSEGCSSCPPADALLQQMDATPHFAGGQLIVLSEHVNYWDHDGWKDPNSSAQLTERQAAYVRALRLKEPYTPQLIVDGTREMSANDPQQIDKILREAASTPTIPVRIGETSVDAGNPMVVRMHIAADGSSDKRNADVYVAVALDRVESQVLYGENGGRHLTHVAVVVELKKVGKLSKGKSFDDVVQLKFKPGIDPKNVRFVAFVQEPGPGKLLGAALRKPAN